MISNMLEMSTVHITEETARWIDAQVIEENPTIIVYPKKDWGWLIHTHDFHGNELTIDEIPNDLVFLFGMATGAQCSWIMLDSDAGIYEDLPQYEW